jgi:CDP-diacylglycerol--glycerol-3-phosphate 3-phosphatidyltransferase
MLVILGKMEFKNSVGIVLFILASITDLLDGQIARKSGQITNFGKLVDPLADKILVCSAFIAFVGNGLMPAWMVAIIVAREFIITGLRSVAASKNIILSAEKLGKHKTTSQIATIIGILLEQSIAELSTTAANLTNPWLPLLVECLKWITVSLTIISGSLYLFKNKNLFINDL